MGLKTVQYNKNEIFPIVKTIIFKKYLYLCNVEKIMLMNEKTFSHVIDDLDLVKSHGGRTATHRRRQKHFEDDSAIAAMKSRVNFLTTLQQGWDGYNALPISNQVIDNMNAFLANVNEKDLTGWRALPEINGTISLQNDEKRAGIQVGDTAFSYFMISGNHVSGNDNVLFAIPTLLNVLREING